MAGPLPRATGMGDVPLSTLTHGKQTMILTVNAGAKTTLLHSPTQFAEQKRGGYGAANLTQAGVRLTQCWWRQESKSI